jgi:hypothetical protein
MPLTLLLQKTRERREDELRVAIEHQRLMKKNFHIYKNSATKIAKRYEEWCKTHKTEPTINMNEIYKEINQ